MRLTKSAPWASAGLVVVTLVLGKVAGASTLEGFEMPVLPPNGVSASPTHPAWTFSGASGAGIQRNGHIPNAPLAPDGRQTAYLKGGSARIATQVFLEKGDHTVSFYVAKGSQDAGNPVQARIDGHPVGVAVTSTNGAFWRYTTTPFPIGTANTYTLDIVSSPAAPSTFVTLVDAVSITRVGAVEPVAIKIMPDDAEGTIRSDIGPWTFGSGFESNRAEIRMSMGAYNGEYSDAPVERRETAKAIMNLKLGSLRFPNGDSSMGYTWSYPDGSLQQTTGGNYTTKQLTPDEITRFTQACLPASPNCKPQLNMQRLLQVNTVFRRDFNDPKWKLNYLDDNLLTSPRKAPSLNTNNVNSAARYAANWAKQDAANALGRTTFWEVGNEDWSRLRPQDYAEIFFAFQNEMRRERSDIKLLAQGLGADFTPPYGTTNQPSEWLGELTKRLAEGQALDSVYAYSIHKYLKAGIYAGEATREGQRTRQTQEMLGRVATGEPVNTVKNLLAKSPAANWKVWVTEFNVNQKGKNGEPEPLQDMGHALVIADWTGKMLEQNVERMFMHSLDHNKEYALVAYANLPGVTLETPRVTVPGYAYARYAQEFGNVLLRNTSVNDTAVSFKDEQGAMLSYPQVGVYSSMTSDRKSLRVMVINRHMTQPADVTLAALTTSRFKFLNGQYGMRTLHAPSIAASNQAQKDLVTWSDWTWRQQNETTGIPAVRLAPASVNLFIVPLDTRMP